jgi:hypothetical protein
MGRYTNQTGDLMSAGGLEFKIKRACTQQKLGIWNFMTDLMISFLSSQEFSDVCDPYKPYPWSVWHWLGAKVAPTTIKSWLFGEQLIQTMPETHEQLWISNIYEYYTHIYIYDYVCICLYNYIIIYIYLYIPVIYVTLCDYIHYIFHWYTTVKTLQTDRRVSVGSSRMNSWHGNPSGTTSWNMTVNGCRPQGPCSLGTRRAGSHGPFTVKVTYLM